MLGHLRRLRGRGKRSKHDQSNVGLVRTRHTPAGDIDSCQVRGFAHRVTRDCDWHYGWHRDREDVEATSYTDREVGERASLEGLESRYLIGFTRRFVLR